jgi:hypothetical protein
MKTRYMTILTTLVFLGLTVSALAGKPDKCPTWPDCGGDDGGGETSATHTAALVSGGFIFDSVDVTLNKKGNSFSTVKELEMDRSDEFGNQAAWDTVFSSCSLFDSTLGIVGSVHVSANWSIDNSGGNQAGTEGSNIRISFRDVVPGGFSEADVDFSLIGTLPSLVPVNENDDPIFIYLTEFSFFGSTQFEGCKSGTLPLGLGNESVLVITKKP